MCPHSSVLRPAVYHQLQLLLHSPFQVSFCCLLGTPTLTLPARNLLPTSSLPGNVCWTSNQSQPLPPVSSSTIPTFQLASSFSPISGKLTRRIQALEFIDNLVLAKPMNSRRWGPSLPGCPHLPAILHWWPSMGVLFVSTSVNKSFTVDVQFHGNHSVKQS